ncbi:peptidase inhibitor 16-like [Ictalurus furcatus]|uniref:peptidase inhibitor 16-like n=1 Tax=Ictalurus furcatus TaxID=66913 RepID=UPI002350DC49|nr:peptidase inhibitor 16-like [Ictalurus furcatus]
MIWRTALHYALFWLILALTSGQLTDEQKAQIVDLHNQYRSSVSPSAGNMQRMLWDKALSQVAANYAAHCRWDHNPRIFGILGENLFMTLGPLIISQPLNLWFNENRDYYFNNRSCAQGKMCGHYTQMVWANTTFVGCAAQFCADVPNFNVQNATILVCNYYPPGNIMGRSPYQQGPACAACPIGTIGCLNNACDRGTGITSGLSTTLIATLSNTVNPASGTSTGSSAGFTKATAAPLLLAGLTAIYIRMT